MSNPVNALLNVRVQNVSQYCECAYRKYVYNISETNSKFLIASFQVILSQSDFLSFDHAPEADPESPGDYWAIRFIDPLRVFSYLPEHRCCNLVPDEFTFGKMPFAPYGCIDDSNCLESKHPQNVTGDNLS